ncbi:hypothetical protein GGS23DRAFT_227463 [Durotheca rogersii]|uniref:uncharacterized protein n=1 Tax=Durotheca rogersii TaxID=419775 RepID=UPI00222048DE|nr:uncharacterized protein GGS23DRAFT_227463 [Durotheca rogersii]KAI5860525.1 hypothetical protein GGS23DRAFT_227463 [Durotheca rogersii]
MRRQLSSYAAPTASGVACCPRRGRCRASNLIYDLGYLARHSARPARIQLTSWRQVGPICASHPGEGYGSFRKRDLSHSWSGLLYAISIRHRATAIRSRVKFGPRYLPLSAGRGREKGRGSGGLLFAGWPVDLVDELNNFQSSQRYPIMSSILSCRVDGVLAGDVSPTSLPEARVPRCSSPFHMFQGSGSHWRGVDVVVLFWPPPRRLDAVRDGGRENSELLHRQGQVVAAAPRWPP